jgi:hypothetical protein
MKAKLAVALILSYHATLRPFSILVGASLLSSVSPADSNLVGLHRQVLWLNSTQKEKKIQENEDYWHFMWNDDRSYGYFKVNVSEQVPFVLWTHLVMQYLCT